ncbi:MAG: metallophosphoesterase [Clostridia bacterium]|nr:metallophosphoesterase [Clostridia bacterium]
MKKVGGLILILIFGIVLICCSSSGNVAVNSETGLESAPPSTQEEVVVVPPVYTPTATPASTLPPTPTPSPSPTPAPTPFTMVWITDTQSVVFTEKTQHVFPEMLDWIVEKQEELDIVAMLHTGDITENGWRADHWAIFEPHLHSLDGKIPYLMIAGNHDIGMRLKDYTAFLDREFVKQAVAEERAYLDGRGMYLTFSGGGCDFIAVGLGWNTTDDEALSWAKSIFDAHPNHIGILLLHWYLDGEQISILGREINDKLVSLCPNLRLVLCGHVMKGLYVSFEFDDDGDGQTDRIVHAMRHNYQSDIVKVGYLRTLVFDPLTRSITVDTYSPVLDDYIYFDDDPEADRFVIENGF